MSRIARPELFSDSTPKKPEPPCIDSADVTDMLRQVFSRKRKRKGYSQCVICGEAKAVRFGKQFILRKGTKVRPGKVSQDILDRVSAGSVLFVCDECATTSPKAIARIGLRQTSRCYDCGDGGVMHPCKCGVNTCNKCRPCKACTLEESAKATSPWPWREVEYLAKLLCTKNQFDGRVNLGGVRGSNLKLSQSVVCPGCGRTLTVTWSRPIREDRYYYFGHAHCPSCENTFAVSKILRWLVVCLLVFIVFLFAGGLVMKKVKARSDLNHHSRVSTSSAQGE